MSRPTKWLVSYIVMLLSLVVLHFWLNIGFDWIDLGGAAGGDEQKKFKVGFLPVT